MSLLFVNACLREDSRTEMLARACLEHRNAAEVDELRLAELEPRPLNAARLAEYNEAVATHNFESPLFDVPKQFAAADEVLIAAPLWNYSIPAILHDYLELACTQGLTFDIDESGAYHSLTHMSSLTFVSTAGGPKPLPEDEHAFGYIRTLAERFWFVPMVEHVAAWGLDIIGADIPAILGAALK